jgi:hypothetical protein
MERAFTAERAAHAHAHARAVAEATADMSALIR